MKAALLLCLALSASACDGCKGSVPILTWHAVMEPQSEYDTAPDALAAQLDALRAAGFHAVSLREVIAHEDAGAPLPDKPVVLTFDDGTRDHFATVLPLLRAREMRATFFVVPTWIGADEKHRHIEIDGGVARPCLILPELRALAGAGMEIGAHGLRHQRLRDLPEPRAREEIFAAKSALEQLLAAPVLFFAWPFNSLRNSQRALVREAGYLAAVAGVVHGDANRFSLYRAPVMRSTTPAQLVATVSGWR